MLSPATKRKEMVTLHPVRCLNASGTAVEERWYPGETYADAEKMVVDAGYTLAKGTPLCRECKMVVVKNPSECCWICNGCVAQ